VRVGVIGAGLLGGTLARLLGQHGHEVVLAARRSRAELEPAVAGWPNVTAGERTDVVGCEVVILAFPWRVAEEALAGLDLAGHVVVDATNPFSEDFDIIDTGGEGSTGTVASLLPGARVVKAFNTLPWEHLVEAADERAPTARRIGIPIATDDVDALDEVSDLAGDLGFTALHVGGLDAGRELMQPACPLFMVPLPARQLEERVRQLTG
jgi:8-hydroxy-5-deazaflavin:NADPH oxidoreductase